MWVCVASRGMDGRAARIGAFSLILGPSSACTWKSLLSFEVIGCLSKNRKTMVSSKRLARDNRLLRKLYLTLGRWRNVSFEENATNAKPGSGLGGHVTQNHEHPTPAGCGAIR